jgi:xylulose-5-phosphate/fructose-6-phosphate phosphoketolase
MSTATQEAISAFGLARSTIDSKPLSAEELRDVDAYFRASLYMCVGMIYLRDNPLLRRPLTTEDVKIRLLGHWGSDPGMSLVYVHLNRLIRKYDLNVIFIAGPGHGAPAVLSHAYLEGTYSEIYPECSEDENGLCRFFRQFSFPAA